MLYAERNFTFMPFYHALAPQVQGIKHLKQYQNNK